MSQSKSTETSYQTKWGFHWAVIVCNCFFEETSKAVEKSMIHALDPRGKGLECNLVAFNGKTKSIF